jgi:nucleoside-diphosphate-sugar epimerase
MTTLITGATGFVGSACTRQIARHRQDVHTCARTAPPEVSSAVSFHAVDLLDLAATGALVAEVRPTHLLHLAWIATPGTYWDSAENDAWLDASQHLLRAFADHGGRRAVVAGTCAEYDWSESGPYRERESPIRPARRYGQAKDALRRWCEQDAPARGVSVAWARLFFLYGPGEHPGRFVPSVVTALLDGRPADCTTGAQVRDFLHVDDAARALLALLGGEVEGPVNVASGEGVTVRSVAKRIAAAAGRPESLRLGVRPTPASEPEEVVADVGRLRREVRWRPELTLERGLAETVDWWRNRAGTS